ncbi:hypothetical protein [Nocardioides humi]|uniref:Uncharacterized protein n=1 Tax=Nocardioides humi TaxID=449461 RepID=A0ABN1ZYD0_9ACTN|nr:hypothetical protein [Nocardioides humi]
MTRRPLLVVATVAVAVAVGITAWVVLPKRAAASAAQDVARRYAELVASGAGDDLRELWAMEATESPGALRTAGALLAGAEERIEVVSVGTPQQAPRSGAPSQSDFTEAVAVEVRYRLAGQEHRWPIVLARREGTRGTDLGDWRVVGPLVGAVAWEQPGFADVASDVYVSTVRQVRRPLVVGGGDEDVQPLYPAAYRVQRRLDPYYASEEGSVVVTAGKAVAPPELAVNPTDRTRDRIRRLVLARIRACGNRDGARDSDDAFYRCPLRDLAEARGVDVWGDDDWWLGLVRKPVVEVDGQRITVSGGRARLRGPQGVLEIRFGGTGRYLLDNQAWRPAIWELDLEDGG